MNPLHKQTRRAAAPSAPSRVIPVTDLTAPLPLAQLLESRLINLIQMQSLVATKAARVMLEDGKHPMDVVARDTGFADRDRMRRAFLRAYGQPPASLKRALKLMEADAV